MIEQQFEIKAIENVKQIINYIVNEEYSKLHIITNINNSWCKDGETQIQGMERFGEWLKGQLEIWSEEEEKEFVIDTFNEKYLEIDEFEGDHAFVTFNPTSNGEVLDFWFEIKFTIDETDELTSEFNINI